MICRLMLVFSIMCVAFSPGNAMATKIIMVVKTSVTVTDKSVDVRLEVANTGDEDALVVTPFLALAGVETGLETTPYIAFEGQRAWSHSFPMSDLNVSGQGTYPLVVKLRYHDANMYPYSMVSVMGVQIGEPSSVDVPVTGKMTAGKIAREGRLDLHVRNTGSTPLDAEVTVVSPAELSVVGDGGVINITSGDEKQISYAIMNNGALPGSSHIMYAIINYSVEGQHGVAILQDDVAVASYIPDKKRSLIITGTVFLVFLFCIVLLVEFRAGLVPLLAVFASAVCTRRFRDGGPARSLDHRDHRRTDCALAGLEAHLDVEARVGGDGVDQIEEFVLLGREPRHVGVALGLADVPGDVEEGQLPVVVATDRKGKGRRLALFIGGCVRPAESIDVIDHPGHRHHSRIRRVSWSR